MTDPILNRSRYDELREAVTQFHADNPVVWQLFCRFTFERIRRGFKHYSVNGIFERIRWETEHPEADRNEFKLNNNYRPFYARRFMKMYPEHDGFFRVRKQISKEQAPVCLPELKPDDFG